MKADLRRAAVIACDGDQVRISFRHASPMVPTPGSDTSFTEIIAFGLPA